MKTNLLRDAIRIALLTGAATAFAPPVLAQQSEAPTELDRIQVTGSRIRQVDMETSAPVLLIDRENIEKQGFDSVADILQNISAAGSPAVSRTTPLASGPSVGGSYIDLRNLGPNRTLVLVNGKRLGIDVNGLQDVSLIPASMVERVEVLKDGASTIYGSDAIAGVINIITRKNFNGAQANAYFGQYSDGDGQREVYDFVIGAAGERGSVTAGVEYSEQDPVFALDRWFAIDRFPAGKGKAPFPGGLSGVTQFGRVTVPGLGNLTLRREVPGLDPRDPASYRPLNATDASNPAEQSTIYTGIERKSLFVNGRYDLSDNVTFESDLLYSDRDSFAQNAGFPYQSAAFDTPMLASSYFNPFGQDVQFTRRGWEVPRQVRNNLTTFRFTAALSGVFEIGESYWDWDAGYLFNQGKGTQISIGNLNTAAVRQAVGPSFLNADGVVQCGTAANPIQLGSGAGQCTPWNPLVPFGYGGSNTAADPNVAAFLYLPGQALSKGETDNYFANLTGTLLKLPAGDLGLAVGVEHRKESGTFSPDALSQTGISTDLATGPTAGEYSLDELYAELQIPVLADVAFARELTLSVATRYSDYDTFGDTLNSKFGFKWKPVDSLLVRGTWAEGFRAADIASLFGGAGQTFSLYTDPCDTSFGAAAGNPRCLQDVPAGFRQAANDPDGLADTPETQTPIPFIAGSNPALLPETSRSKTLGVVYSPSFVSGLNLSLDWWNIRIDNTIIADSETQVLADCYLRGIESRCNAPTGSRFTRDPVTGAIASFITTGINAGYIEVEGFDFDVNYKLDTAWGRFSAAWLSTYTSKSELKTDNLSDNPPEQLVGLANNARGASFRIRSNLNLSWEKGPFGISFGSRYFSGVKEPCQTFPGAPCNLPDFQAPDTGGSVSPRNRTGSNTFHDVQFRYTAPWNATISVGANNVFDHYSAPLYSRPNSGFSYYGGFDIGRLVYFKYQQRF
jgi:iron complex outermembrane receptor protein